MEKYWRQNVFWRCVVVAVALVCTVAASGAARVVVVDSATNKPLPMASLFDSKGNALGVCDTKGRAMAIPSTSYPITVRYLGFKEKSVTTASCDTIFLQENSTNLPEVVIESRQHKVLHMLAYVREYSTLSTYTDTVLLFREKMVDYMLVPDKSVRYKGWSNPRMLKSKSYYRFTNSQGLDSVSNVSNHHFSWSDWIGIASAVKLPTALEGMVHGSDTVYGKYSPTEVWTKKDGRVGVSVNVMADTTSRKWVPDLSGFFKNGLDFEKFMIGFNYDNVVADSVSAEDLTGYSYSIESRGRGRDMFRFNRTDEPFFVTTYAEIYLVDKEYISLKEARKWEHNRFEKYDKGIVKPVEAPALQPSVQTLVARVDNIDMSGIRLDFAPDKTMISENFGKPKKFDIGTCILSILKNLTGISEYKYRKNVKNKWDKFRKEKTTVNKIRKKE